MPYKRKIDPLNQRLSRVEEQAFARQVVHFFQNQGRKSKKVTVAYFKKQGKHRLVIANIVERYLKNGTADYQYKNSGVERPRTVSTPRKIGQVEKLFHKNPSVSLRVGANKTGLKRASSAYIKNKILDLHSFTKKSAPKYVKDQEKRSKSGCRKIYTDLSKNKVIILDDETYVPLEPTQVPGRSFYSAKNKDEIDDKHKFKHKQKFPEKYLVWQAIDEDGNVIEVYISKGTIKESTYEMILEDCLLPFIKKYHPNMEILFWPDLSTTHYANVIQR